jgi:hypothetical protein
MLLSENSYLMVVLKQFWWITKIYLHKHILVTCLKTGTSSVCQFYDSPRQLICFLRTFFRVREADLLKSTVGPIVDQNCAHGLPRLPGSYSIHKQFFRQTHCFTYIVSAPASSFFIPASSQPAGSMYCFVQLFLLQLPNRPTGPSI